MTLTAPDGRSRGSVRRQDLAVHAERDVAAGDLLQLRRERVVEQEPDAQRAEDVGLVEADGDRHGHELQDAVGLRDRLSLSRPSAAAAHRRLACRRPARRAAMAPTVASTPPAFVGDEQEVRVQLVLIVARDVLHRRRIVGVDGGLEPAARRR